VIRWVRDCSRPWKYRGKKRHDIRNAAEAAFSVLSSKRCQSQRQCRRSLCPKSVAETPSTSRSASYIGFGAIYFKVDEYRPRTCRLFKNTKYVPRNESAFGHRGGKESRSTAWSGSF